MLLLVPQKQTCAQLVDESCLDHPLFCLWETEMLGEKLEWEPDGGWGLLGPYSVAWLTFSWTYRHLCWLLTCDTRRPSSL